MGAVSGTVYDSAGAPAAGRAVRAYRRDTGALLGAYTSSDGESSSDANFSDVSLLLHGGGSDGSTTFTDSSPDARTLSVAAGSPEIDTAQSKFGGSSILFPGGGARIHTADTLPTRLDVGLHGGTIEFFVRFSSFTGPRSHIIGAWLSSNGWTIELAGNTSIFFGRDGDGTNSASFSGLAAGVWYHFAFVFRGASGNTIDFWLDGIFKGTTTRDTPSSSTSRRLTVGARSDGGLALDAWIDELRITSVARYTNGVNFDVPTAAYPDADSVLPEGEYLIDCGAYTGEVQVVCLDDDAGTLENDLILRTFPV